MKNETLETLNRNDPEGRLPLEQEQQVRRERLEEAQAQCRQLEREFFEAGHDLVSFDLKLISEHIKDCEQELKEAIPWYVPFEELMGIPVIGEKADKFIANVNRLNGVQAEVNNRLISLRIYPQFKELSDDRQNERGLIFLYILWDGTLRLQTIYQYETLFQDTQPLFQDNNTLQVSNPETINSIDIGFIGRHVHQNYGLEPILGTLAVDRHRRIADKGIHRGYVDIYNQSGELQSRNYYENDFSNKLKQV